MIKFSRLLKMAGYAYPGASKMKWFYTKPYLRMTDSLLHYPDISNITGKKINWMYDKPYNRGDVLMIYGPNTIELKGLPMGRTPEYLQERLRRFFSKYGVVSFCRCEPHDLDPYQCNGTAYVTFRSKPASVKAATANLVLPFTLHGKIIKIRHLDTDAKNDPNYLYKQKHYNNEIIAITRDLYKKLCRVGRCKLENISQELYERNFFTGKLHKAGLSIHMRFGTWKNYLTHPPFNQLFNLHDGVVTLFLSGCDSMERVLQNGLIFLDRKLDETLTEHWRKDKMPLIEQAQRHSDSLHHLRPLPEQLQLLSRSHNMYRLHDERHLLKIALKQKRNELRKLYRKKDDRLKKTP